MEAPSAGIPLHRFRRPCTSLSDQSASGSGAAYPLSTSLSVFSFASILAVAAISSQTLVIQQGRSRPQLLPGVISLAAVLVTKYPDRENARLLPWTVVALGAGFLSGFVNGMAITRFASPPLVATLAVNALLNGAVLLFSHHPRGPQHIRRASWLSRLRRRPGSGEFPISQLRAFIAVVIVEVGIRATR